MFFKISRGAKYITHSKSKLPNLGKIILAPPPLPNPGCDTEGRSQNLTKIISNCRGFGGMLSKENGGTLKNDVEKILNIYLHTIMAPPIMPPPPPK